MAMRNLDKLFFCSLSVLSADTLTLRDFKDTVDRPGIFRYHFKTVDPDFGTVKEEVRRECNHIICFISTLQRCHCDVTVMSL